MIRFAERFAGLAALTVLIMALAGLLAGCGMDHSPVAQDETTIASTPEGPMRLAFSPEAARRAAKIAQEGRSVSEVIGAEGGKLVVIDKHGPGKADNLRVRLKVLENTLVEPVPITMTVYGKYLSELVVAFEPGGLQFLEPARLRIRMGPELDDLSPGESEITLWHIYEDGTVEETEIRGQRVTQDGYRVIRANIPGFSRYSPGGGD